MFLLTEEDKKTEGAYAVKDRNGEKVLFMFSEEDDALRYALQLEDEHGTKMSTIEVEEDLAIKAVRCTTTSTLSLRLMIS